MNDAACRSVGPPVVLLHGTFSTVASNFSALVPALRAAGRCVYGVDYGFGGLSAVVDSAAQEAEFVRQVLAVTGATQVDVVGYSQGALVLRAALRLDGLADQVATAVLLAPSFHGSTAPGLRAAPSRVCPACADQIAGSALLTRLEKNGDLDGTVRYAVLSTERDDVVTPWQSQVPHGPADRVTSTTVEHLCPHLLVDHPHLPGYPQVVNWTVAALAAQGRPGPDAMPCG